MELLFVGLIVGIVLGVWLAVGALYLFQSRGGIKQSVRLQWLSRSGSATHTPPPSSKTPAFKLSIETVQEQHAFERLVTMAHGDRVTAERLVGYEYGRRPDAPSEELIDTAIERWIRDNR